MPEFWSKKVASIAAENQEANKYPSLKWGLVAFFAGIGFIIINSMSPSLYNQDNYRNFTENSVLPFGIELVCISLGFIVYFLIVTFMKKKNKGAGSREAEVRSSKTSDFGLQSSNFLHLHQPIPPNRGIREAIHQFSCVSFLKAEYQLSKAIHQGMQFSGISYHPFEVYPELPANYRYRALQQRFWQSVHPVCLNALILSRPSDKETAPRIRLRTDSVSLVQSIRQSSLNILGACFIRS